jgi:pimeloyl-ACP methyl ester carboxylesterase
MHDRHSPFEEQMSIAKGYPRSLEMLDGRQIETEQFGNSKDHPVIVLHGSPGHASGPIPRYHTLNMLGVQVVTYSRPGYGRSDRYEGRRVVDEAMHIEAIADAYGFDTFSVLGRSGGGPGALAAAALLPERVKNAAIIVSPASSHDLGKTLWEGMNPDNQRIHQASPEKLKDDMAEFTRNIQRDPAYLLHHLRPYMAEPDKEITDDIVISHLLRKSYREGLRQEDAMGWYDDTIALNDPNGWGFATPDIQAPTLLWYAEDDPFTPPEHGVCLHDLIDKSHLVIAPGRSHFSSIEYFPQILAWCRDS